MLDCNARPAHLVRYAAGFVATLLVAVSACRDSSDRTPSPATPVTPAGPTEPVSPKPSSPADPVARIFIADADGTNWRNVAVGDGAAWSPDGRQLLYHRGFSNMETPILGSLYVINTDGTGLRTLARGRWGSWSPDGKRILFTDDNGLEIINADGTDQSLLLPRGFNSEALLGPGKPAWSPDGTRIAFQTLDDAGEVPSQVYVMNADGSGLHRVSHGSRNYEAEPAWSPDGKELVYSWGGQALVITNADGGEPRTICRDCTIASRAKAVWWPDGFHIAFNVFNTTAIIDLRSPTVRPFLGDAYDLAISPDGSSIAFTSTRP